MQIKNTKNIEVVQKFGTLCGSLFISVLVLNCTNPKINVELSTSGCYGKCPILDLRLEGDQLLINFIDNFDSLKGVYLYNLDKDERLQFKKLISNIDITSLKEEYVAHISDVQTYQLEIRGKDFFKSVYIYEGYAPKKLEELITYLILFKDKKNLIKIEDSIKFNTRDRLPIIKMPVPPLPD